MCRLFLCILACFALSFSSFGQTREIITIAGSSSTGSYGGDGGRADSALLHGPNGVTVDPAGNVFIEDFYNFRVRKVDGAGYISTYAGGGSHVVLPGDSVLAPSSRIDPNGVTTDSHGNLYISDNSYSVVWKVKASTQIITQYSGWYGNRGYMGDSGLAVNAKMSHPRGMCVDSKGNLYIAEAGNHVIRKVDSFGKIWTFAGNGVGFFAGDNGYAKYASLDSPYDITVDKYDNFYIADYKNQVIRKIDTSGIITTVAGTPGFPYFSGDGGLAISATLNNPRGIAVDRNGFLYIADTKNNVIRMVDTFGIITTIAGNNTPGFGGDHGAAGGANLFAPQDLAVDTFGSIFVADAENQRIRKIYNATTAVSKISSGYHLNAYPNPCTDQINIAGLKAGDKVAIYNMVGNHVSSTWGVNNEALQTFPMADLPIGVYFAKVVDANDNIKAVIRLVKVD